MAVAPLAGRASVRGEIVLLFALAQSEAAEAHSTNIVSEVREMMQREGIAEMDALKRVARARGMGKSEAYRELQREQNRLR